MCVFLFSYLFSFVCVMFVWLLFDVVFVCVCVDDVVAEHGLGLRRPGPRVVVAVVVVVVVGVE